ncbi:fumarate hydratase [Enterobacter cloacae subsp. cloacae]|nr:fumarate hydratase [Enterobacter cloacae subsp. cloacae]
MWWREDAYHTGTAACPPYHIIRDWRNLRGSDAQNSEASLHSVLRRPAYRGNEHNGRSAMFRSNRNCSEESAEPGSWGVQFGGKYFAHDIRADPFRRATAPPRPIGMGVSCSADRNIKAKINRDGSD